MKTTLLKITISIITLLAATTIKGQNIVPNPSFEQYSACPNFTSQVNNYVNNWSNYRPSSDFLHSCSSNNISSTPENFAGWQIPASGDGYAGLIGYGSNIADLREYIGVKLDTNLVIGNNYYLSFKVSLAETSGFAVNKLGLLFTTVPYCENFTPLSYTCDSPSVKLSPVNYAHLFSPSIISDSTTWTTISGGFVADSAYDYLAIGLFFDDNNINVQNLPQGGTNSYYYIDDVCVSQDSLTCYNFSLSIKDEQLSSIIKTYPNPTSGQLTISLKEVSLGIVSIRNYLGQIIKRKEFNNTKEFNINLDGPSGIYFIQLEIDGQVITKKVVKE